MDWLIDDICRLNHALNLNAGSFQATGQSATTRRKTNSFGRGMTEKRQMEDEVRSCKGVIPETDQLPSCHDHIMTKDRNVKSLRNRKTMRLENKTLCNYSLNRGTRHLERDFSPGKFCTCFLVRGTTSFCKGNYNFVYRRECKVECINATQ